MLVLVDFAVLVDDFSGSNVWEFVCALHVLDGRTRYMFFFFSIFHLLVIICCRYMYGNLCVPYNSRSYRTGSSWSRFIIMD